MLNKMSNESKNKLEIKDNFERLKKKKKPLGRKKKNHDWVNNDVKGHLSNHRDKSVW